MRKGTSRTSTPRWRALRREVLLRDLHVCQICKRYTGQPEVDHIIPLFRGGDEWDIDNLQCVCRPCHEEKTRKELGHAPPVEGRGEWLDYVKSLSTQPRNYDET